MPVLGTKMEIWLARRIGWALGADVSHGVAIGGAVVQRIGRPLQPQRSP